MRASLDISAVFLGCIAVVGRKTNLGKEAEVVQFPLLVLRERLCWKEVKRPRLGISKNGFNRWDVITEGFAACSSCYHNHMLVAANCVQRGGLMCIQASDALSCQPGGEDRRNR